MISSIFLTSNSFFPLISKPTCTCITSSTATLIDNIFTNNLDFNMASRILYSDLSDHFPIFQITQTKLISDSTPKKKYIRQINSYSTSQFLSKLKNIDWTFLYELNLVNDCYDRFANCIIPIYNQSFPLKPVITETCCSIKPWFSNALYVSYNRKNSLYKQYVLNPTLQNKSRYQKFHYKYNSLIKIARKKYFHDKLTSISSNLKKTWAVIKQVLTKKQTQQTFKTMKDSDGIYSDPNQIAMKFNNFFTNIGPSLANNLPPQCDLTENL